MARPGLRLRLHLALARRGRTGPVPRLPDRPPGPVLWAHAEGEDAGRALAHLCARIAQTRPDLALVGTGTVRGPGIHAADLPEDRPHAADAFAERLRPDVVLWASHDLRPALLEAVARRGAHLVALGLEDRPFSWPGRRWGPDPSVAVLHLFRRIFAASEPALRALRRLGLESARLSHHGPLRDAGPPPDPDETEQPEPGIQLAGRPLWLAALITAEEADPVLRAHLRAVRLAHRLLLVTVPRDPEDAGAIEDTARSLGLRFCHWGRGEIPDENTQVLLTDGPEDRAVWYRVAPLAFIGGSLLPRGGGADPLEAATLGAAILYGPNVGQHLAAYSRLVQAGAARIVRDSDSLSAAVSTLVAPDLAAAMALAGWQVISDGAALGDAVLAEVEQALDRTEPA